MPGTEAEEVNKGTSQIVNLIIWNNILREPYNMMVMIQSPSRTAYND